ncbi:YncE family protein [bacterium]
MNFVYHLFYQAILKLKTIQFTFSILIAIYILVTGFNSSIIQAQGTLLNPFETINVEVVSNDCSGVKAMLMNKDASRVYSINLEGMGVYEFDRSSKQILRKLKFIATPGKGFDYSKKVWIDSYQEKPVEACLTHQGRYLWLSLHNAEGIVIWDLENNNTHIENKPFKEAWLYEQSLDTSLNDIASFESKTIKTKVKLLWIKTGSTPKVITSSPDGKYLFVSNWHSHTVSVINIESPDPNDWSKITDLKLSPIPRGLAVTPDSKTLYVAQMGSRIINVIDLANMNKLRSIDVGINPRHLVINNNYLYSSLNLSAKLVKIDLTDESILQKVSTGQTPRTIVCTPDGRYLFVTCYKENTVQLFSTETLELLQTWKSPGHPVCIDIFQNKEWIEAWVGNHTYGNVRVFTLKLNNGIDGDKIELFDTSE